MPGALQLRERGLHRLAVARALERDVERLVDEVVRHRRASRARRAATVRAPSCLAQRAARLVRLAHDDVVDAQRRERGDGQEADRAAAGDEPARARPGARRARVMPCSATASGSASAACFERQAVGDAQQLRRPGSSCSARTRPASRPRRCRPGRARRTATAGARGSTRTRRTSAIGPPTTRSPTAQPVTAVADRDDRAAVLVALDRALVPAPLEEEVEVGAADPAVADLEQHLVRAGCRDGVDPRPDVPEPHEDRGGHGRRGAVRSRSCVRPCRKRRPNLTRASRLRGRVRDCGRSSAPPCGGPRERRRRHPRRDARRRHRCAGAAGRRRDHRRRRDRDRRAPRRRRASSTPPATS